MDGSETVKFAAKCLATSLVLASLGAIVEALFHATWLTILIWVLACTPFAFSFYRLRSVHRLAYGLFELFIAVASLYAGIWKLSVIESPTSFEQLATVSLVIYAGIYFMIRALDNIGVGLRVKNSKWLSRWNRAFQIKG